MTGICTPGASSLVSVALIVMVEITAVMLWMEGEQMRADWQRIERHMSRRSAPCRWRKEGYDMMDTQLSLLSSLISLLCPLY